MCAFNEEFSSVLDQSHFELKNEIFTPCLFKHFLACKGEWNSFQISHLFIFRQRAASIRSIVCMCVCVCVCIISQFFSNIARRRTMSYHKAGMILI